MLRPKAIIAICAIIAIAVVAYFSAKGGHWHGYVWHDETDNPSQIREVPSPAEHAHNGERIRKAQPMPAVPPIENISQTKGNNYWKELGLEPPDGNWTWAWDDEGNYYKSYEGRFTGFKVITQMGYAPTLEQFQRGKQLHNEWHKAKSEGNDAEVKRLKAEIETLIEESQGEVPSFTGGVYRSAPGESKEDAIRNGDRQRQEAIRRLYREYGLEHLLN